jgi:hypothetical protein
MGRFRLKNKIRNPCHLCGKESTRMAVTYMFPNRQIGFWSRFKRKHLKNMTALKDCVCNDCYFEVQHGLFTLHCIKCKHSVKIPIEDCYKFDKLYCPYCKKAIWNLEG